MSRYRQTMREALQSVRENTMGYIVKFSNSKGAKIAQAWYKDEKSAKEALDAIRKNGGNGIISKGKMNEEGDHEVSMARGELEAIADKATQLAGALQGKSDEGNPLEAWVQSKITKAKDYINSVSDYLTYNPDMKQNEESELEESAAAREIDRTNTRKNNMDYQMYKKSAELLRKKDYKALGKHIYKSETAPKEYVMSVIAKKEPSVFKKLYGNQAGYYSLMKPLNMSEEIDVNEKISDIFKANKEGESVDDIAKRLKLSTSMVKKLLGETNIDSDNVKKGDSEKEKELKIKLDKEKDQDALEKQLIAAQGQINILKQKLENEKNKVIKPEPNRETGEVPLTIGIAHAEFKKKKEEVKEETLEEMDKKEREKRLQRAKDMIKYYDMMKKKALKGPNKELAKKMLKSDLNNDDENTVKKIITKLKGASDAHAGQAKDLEKALKSEAVKNLDEFTSNQIKDLQKSYGDLKGKTISPEKATALSKHLDRIDLMSLRQLLKAKIPFVSTLARNKIYKKTGKFEDRRLYAEAIAGLKKKADKSGMPYSILKKVYDRGMAAWKSGHRPGASQQQWAFARVNSFITKSSGTWGGADKDLASKVKGSK